MKWEYRIVKLESGDLIASYLDEFGVQGWELCVFGDNFLIFKRVKEILKWEYNVIPIVSTNENTEYYFNCSGKMGWELVSVSNNVAYFKRPKPNAEIKEDFERYNQALEGYFGGKVG
ncbi:MAG: DUF2812 domain-containing protein [Candidatus Hodarchaeales archaeon]